jgi:hypothetical protein
MMVNGAKMDSIFSFPDLDCRIIFFIPITVALYLSLNRNQSKNLPETVDLGLGILCTIVTRKEEYKVDITFNIFIIVLSDQPMTFRMLGVTKLVNVRL